MKLLRVFGLYLFLIGISALYGGWMIIFSDAMKFPEGFLKTTPFDSFVIPGIILAFVVGGTQIIAAILLWTRNKFMYEATAIAGFGLLIWLVTEIYMIPTHHMIQIVYLGFAIITLISLMLLLKFKPMQ